MATLTRVVTIIMFS